MLINHFNLLTICPEWEAGNLEDLTVTCQGTVVPIDGLTGAVNVSISGYYEGIEYNWCPHLTWEQYQQFVRVGYHGTKARHLAHKRIRENRLRATE